MSQFSSIFSQLLSLFPRNDFYREVYETKAERHSLRSFAKMIDYLKKNLYYKSKNNNVTSELKKLSNFCRY